MDQLFGHTGTSDILIPTSVTVCFIGAYPDTLCMISPTSMAGVRRSLVHLDRHGSGDFLFLLLFWSSFMPDGHFQMSMRYLSNCKIVMTYNGSS
jgi:hypothetical protein